MNDIQITPVRTARERRRFLTFPWTVYRDDPLWVPPLLPEQAKQIDPQRGVFFRRGTAEFFIARREGKLVGTICTAEDPPTNEVRQKNECVFGFFEYLEDYDVFKALIEHATNWARDRGLDTLLGPFNLDYEDAYGVLVEGRERPPALLCGHTPAYYQDFMERYGFQPSRGDNIAFFIDPTAPGLPRIAKLAPRLRERGKVTVRGADLSQWDREVDNVFYLLNTALDGTEFSIPWDRNALDTTLRQFRRIADPEMILFAEVDEKVVGWLPGIPNLNEVFIHVNGLRYPWNYLQLFWRIRRPTTGLSLKSVLVIPEYWNKGVAIILFDEIMRRGLERGYQWADLSLTSDDNVHAPIIYHHIGAKVYKRYRVYQLPL